MGKVQKNLNVELGFIKSKSGNVCAVLYADLGYRKTAISFDELLICEVLGVHMKDLYIAKNEFLESLSK